MKIQAVWRARDTRHFLEHPAARVFCSRHPAYSNDESKHQRRCSTCFLQDLYLYNLKHSTFGTRLSTCSWDVRCLYLMNYDIARVTYVAR